ncbi:MAG: hypothetical protein HOE80_00040 [Candidatus Magasanikbacteria bacterium]|nr:hypothetical protein [Candidatus Magasanikbacteria bacterium]MBT4071102.1 hypothetical protein [Candidatus Magasanikbacteria bacterium]
MSILDRVRFNPSFVGHVGLEQEFFLTQKQGSDTIAVPLSKFFLEMMRLDYGVLSWTYELSSCQVEFRTQPHASVLELLYELKRNIVLGEYVARLTGCMLEPNEVMPESGFPLDHFPDTRYLYIVEYLNRVQLSAAMRVAGTHVHYGCKDPKHALRVYNALRKESPKFIEMGDFSGGERLRLYGLVAGDMVPPEYKSLAEFDAAAKQYKFDKNLSNCWHLVRITKHGTVEVRAFGNTSDIGVIDSWVSTVKRIGDSA